MPLRGADPIDARDLFVPFCPHPRRRRSAVHPSRGPSVWPGWGGWGAVLESNGHKKEMSGYSPSSTNNIMELTAAIEALKALKKPSRVIVCSDSNYVIQGMTSWIHGWIKNNWRTAGKKPVKNKELWQALAAAAPHQVDWVWVKGHAGHPGNERADQLANEAMDKRGG